MRAKRAEPRKKGSTQPFEQSIVSRNALVLGVVGSDSLKNPVTQEAPKLSGDDLVLGSQ